MTDSSSVLIMADDVQSILERRAAAAELQRGGITVHALFRRGAMPATPPPGLRLHRMRVGGPNPARRGLARALAATGDLRRFIARDQVFRAEAPGARAVLLLDDRVGSIAPFLGRFANLDVITGAHAGPYLDRLVTLARLRVALMDLDGSGVDPFLDALLPLAAVPRSGLVSDLDRETDRLLGEVLGGLYATRGPASLGRVLARLRARMEAEGATLGDPQMLAWLARTDLDVSGDTDLDPVGLAAAVLDRAEVHLERPGPAEEPGAGFAAASARASLALQLVFHRELHSDRPTGPLTQDPAGYLAPLRDTRIWQLLTTPSQRSDQVTPVPGRRSVTILPGAYPRFAERLVEAISARRDLKVSTLDLRELDPRFGTMGGWPFAVTQRLKAGLGEQVRWSAPPKIKKSAVVIADWADKGAVWASLVTPPRVRLVVRVHAVDALRPWIHLVDWGRVDELVVVSEHIKNLVTGALGAALDGVKIRVTPPPVPNRLPEPDQDPHELPHRTLVMVGWAQRVKDPLMALDILAELRSTEPDWRLLLVGPDFVDGAVASGRIYAEQFRARAMADDVRDAIVYTGYRDDVDVVLRSATHLLNTSVREGQPQAVIEGMTAGAIPVIREWPQFARQRAARGIYGDRWVVDTVEEAVAMIRATSTPEDFRRERAAVHHWLTARRESVNADRAARALVAIPAPARRPTAESDPGDAAPATTAALDRINELLESDDPTEVPALIESYLQDHAHHGSDDADGLRAVAGVCRRIGALNLQRVAVRRLLDIRPGDLRSRASADRLEGQWVELDPNWAPSIGPAVEARLPRTVDPVPSRVLNVLKISMPQRQSGYSVRGMYTMRGLRACGFEPVAVTALDFPTSIGAGPPAAVEEVDGVRHLRLLRDFAPEHERFDAYLDDWATALAQVVARERPAVIHAHSGHRGYEAAMVALTVARRFGLPLVYEVRGFFEALWTTDRNWAESGELFHLRRAAEARVMHAADAVVTLSDSMRQDIIDRGIPAEKVTVVPNGADIDQFTPRPRDPALTQRLGLTGQIVFGYVSNLDHPREGHELLIDAAVEMRSAGVPVTALIVGDGRRRAELEEYVERRGARQAVVFTGKVPHDEVLDYYAQYDLFVIPRIDERAARLVTPLKPYEAMAAGVPLIVSDLPALAEITGGGARGETFAVGDAADLAATVQRLAADPERRAALAEAARAWVIAERQWVSNAQRYQAVYDAIVD